MNVGIAGSGQLGYMMILESRKLGISFNVIGQDLDGPASRIADRSYIYEDYKEFVDRSDVVTYEFEHVDGRVLDYAESEGKLKPGIFPVKLKRDRSLEKDFLHSKDLPVAEYKIAMSAVEALEIAENFGDCVIKSVSGGYDGKGQYFVKGGKVPSSIPEGKYVVEKFIKFQYEASVIASRSLDGTVSMHKPSFNLNRKGILFYNAAPVSDNGMNDAVRRLLVELDYVGVLGVEFFIADNKTIINEFAPRVHNTGHHTLMGSSISQFEQHIRAICGYEIPDPVLYRPSGILNLIGVNPDRKTVEDILRFPETQFYWYGKNVIRRGRKAGHINVTAETIEEVHSKIKKLTEIVYGNDPDKFL
ncbi:MAG: 5-(carboxyamino)imidazole ribonucleotide synthase [Candidatus Thermoplasmatota archaeon]|jgi:5-(carboxyamino)imidazole ribonucleotide synthase|nr:5-(carboxyamino)imidazole ribonucleotide synthase [Candidatus Thermoplasmatota archaeon]